MDFYIVTGASRGLGLGLARRALEAGHEVASLSRGPGPLSGAKRFSHIACDLAEVESLPAVLTEALRARQPLTQYRALHLVNNAAVIGPVGIAETNPPDEIVRNINVNLIAPMVLGRAFLKSLDGTSVERTITNVSSGVASHPLPSWSAYSVAKAGLETDIRTMVLESRENRKLRFAIFNPGIMDTEMQAQIRATPKEAFPGVERFREYKEQGQLRDPERVADVLFGVVSGGIGTKDRVDYNVTDYL